MTTVKTRSGRVSKQPNRLEPTEVPEDDITTTTYQTMIFVKQMGKTYAKPTMRVNQMMKLTRTSKVI